MIKAHIDIRYDINRYLKVMRMVANNTEIFSDPETQESVRTAINDCVVVNGRIHCLNSAVRYIDIFLESEEHKNFVAQWCKENELEVTFDEDRLP